MFISDRILKTTKNLQKTLMIKNYPEKVFPGWLQIFSALPGEYSRVSIFFSPAKIKWNWQMNAKIRRLETSIRSSEGTAEGVRPQEARALQGIRYLQQQTTWENAELYKVDIGISLFGNDENEVLKRSEKVAKKLANMNIQLDPAFLTQFNAWTLSGLTGSLPKRSFKSRMLDGEAAACFYPFLDGSLTDEWGVYVGSKATNGGLVFLDLISGSNAKNFLVLGKTGEGKSTFMKSLGVGLQGCGMRIFAIDVDREYFDITRKLNGVIVDTINSKFPDPTRIAAEIGDPDEDANRLKQAETTIFWVVGLLAIDMNHLEKNACDTAISALWLESGINREIKATWDLPHGGIKRWYEILEADDSETREGAASLRAKVRIFFRGSQQGFFTEPGEEVDLYDNDFINFDIANAVNNTDDPHTVSIKLAMTFATVWDMIRREKARGEVYTAVIFDEGQRALPVASISDFVLRIATTARKFNSMAVLATNNSAVLWGDKTGGTQGGSGLWNNTHYKVFFYSEESEIKQMAEHGQLSDTVTQAIGKLQGSYSYIIETPKGYDRLRMVLPPEELKLYKTRGLKKEG